MLRIHLRTCFEINEPKQTGSYSFFPRSSEDKNQLFSTEKTRKGTGLKAHVTSRPDIGRGRRAPADGAEYVGFGWFYAPKGLEDSARGFNLGNIHPRRRALKGRKIEREKNI